MFEDEIFYSELRAISSQNSQHKFVQRNGQYDAFYVIYEFEVESAREIPKGLLKKLLIVKISMLLLYYKF